MDLSAISRFFTDLLDSAQQGLSGLLEQEEALLFLAGLLDLILSGFLPLLALLVVVRCARSLLQGKPERETWGWLTTPQGEHYFLHHWEVLLGRSRACDVVLTDSTVSRNHAALTRDARGHWLLHPMKSKNGVLLNGKAALSTLPLSNGDVLSLGTTQLAFQSISPAQEEEQARNRTRPGKVFSPGVTLFLLTLFQAILCLKCVDASEPEYRQAVYVSFGVLALVMWLVYTIYRILRRTGFEIETLAFFLTSLCMTVTAVSTPATIYTQLFAVILGQVLFFALSIVLRDLDLAKSLRWPAVIGAAGLLAFNLLLGETLFGARNWVSIGPLSFQPSELVKVIFILAGATTLDRMFARRNLIFTLVFSAYCVGCLALMSDFGTAVIFFVAFLAIAFLRSGDLPSVCFMTAAAVFAGFIVLKFKPYIANRFAAYRHVWEDPSGMGYQQTRTMSAMASGGLFGQGVGEGWLKNIGAANTDLVFGVLAEELGLIIAILAVTVILLLALFAVKSAIAGRSTFYVIAACSTAMIFLVQTMLNVFGSTDLLPLTGVTFPFVSCGGSSMMACWCLLAYIKASDTRQNAGIAVRLPRRVKGTSASADRAHAPQFTMTPEPPSRQESFREDPQAAAATRPLERVASSATRWSPDGFSARLSVHREDDPSGRG